MLALIAVYFGNYLYIMPPEAISAVIPILQPLSQRFSYHGHPRLSVVHPILTDEALATTIPL
jgi:hypothetical protein